MSQRLTVIQTLPALNAGGVERGTIEIAAELVRRGHRALVVSAGGRMVEELLATGAEHILLDIGKKSPGGLLKVSRLRQIIRDSEASILHTRSRFPAWLSWLAWRGMKKERQRPVFITSVHGPYSVNAYSRIMMRGEHVIAISRFIRHYIEKNYPAMDMSRVRVIPRGIDPARFPYGFQPAKEWRAPWMAAPVFQNRGLIVTLPARITRWKGQEDFIHVVSRIKKAGVDVLGIIAGGVEKRRRGFRAGLEATVHKFGLADNIFFSGHRNDLKEIMSVSDLVFSLAREPEAFGRSSLEALGLGVPVIAYDHGGAGEVLKEVFPAGLVAPLNIEAAAERALEFHCQRPVVPDRQPFTLDAMLDQTIELYTHAAR